MDLFGITGTEIVGYLASFMVLLSFTIKDVKKIRMVNMLGCILFVIYGFLIPSLRVGLPIIIANAAILGTHIFYLLKRDSK
ncbi:MAG: uroporphyrinogen decarboxylase [Flavobacteriaceae bacterium]|nr:uroporphyrinogen decarboxylase [Mangrovimonas sp.]MCB0425976.1 uroporphyrinogen decarboxylase [Mangrovimonas sp.]HPF97923.1 uroporphyrinogen decarboxylase [Mangrovimonas sp.]HRV55991.1 uroporphyrinogen decarboxylase [Mangrovimonas sp.]